MVKLIAKLLFAIICLCCSINSGSCLLTKTARKINNFLTEAKNVGFCTVILVDVTPEESQFLVHFTCFNFYT
jgi:hypothetical protein